MQDLLKYSLLIFYVIINEFELYFAIIWKRDMIARYFDNKKDYRKDGLVINLEKNGR